MNPKTEVTRKQSMPNFPKNIFSPPKLSKASTFLTRKCKCFKYNFLFFISVVLEMHLVYTKKDLLLASQDINLTVSINKNIENFLIWPRSFYEIFYPNKINILVQYLQCNLSLNNLLNTNLKRSTITQTNYNNWI